MNILLKNYLWIILFIIPLCTIMLSCKSKPISIPEHFKHVDQMLWVVSDLDIVKSHWEKLGFSQVIDLGTLDVKMHISGKQAEIRLAKANLGGAHVNWIQPLDEKSIFAEFRQQHGDGALSLVHRLPGEKEVAAEIDRLTGLGVEVLEKIEINTRQGNLNYVLLDTGTEGKYVLGYTYGNACKKVVAKLLPDNRHAMKLNQYAFAIRDAHNVSAYWNKLGQPEFQINHPELGNTRYYGKPVGHKLIQGWQRHGTIAYEWCMPVEPPIVYEDHINKHGEGIHHLAFTVADMDKVLEDFTSLGYAVSMGGTWGEKGKPGSGRYEYIDTDAAGGLTLELLWNFQE
jgi:hypothetical protein